MSIVPMRFRDWWDDWEQQTALAPFSRTSRLLDQQFGLGLRRDDLLSSFLKPQPSVLRSGYIRPWDSQALNRLDSGSTLNIDKEKFQVSGGARVDDGVGCARNLFPVLRSFGWPCEIVIGKCNTECNLKDRFSVQ